MFLQGHVDALTTSGFVEGWAFDRDDPGHPLSVCVQADGADIATGLANIYRWDLADAAYGTGWCAFRLRLTIPAAAASSTTLTLLQLPARTEITHAATVAIRPEDDPAITHLEAVIRTDPTCLQSIDQLRACRPVFEAFMEQNGIEAFVSAAYLYVLGRPADATGLPHYAASLREGLMTPFDVLRIFYESDEFNPATRVLIAPPEPGFAFHRT